MNQQAVDQAHSDEQLRDVLRLMAVGVMLIDTDGRIEYANSAALGGRDSLDVIGQLAADPAWQLTDQFGRVLAYDALPVPTVLREKRAVRDVQLGAPNLDGSMRWMLVNATPRLDASGEMSGAVVTVEDVTERRALAEQLSQAQKIEGIGLFAGGIAHDFNNLLTAIIGNAELALATVQPESELATLVGEVRDAALRGATLTRQLLTFARKQVVQPRPSRLDQLIAGIETLLHRVVGESIVLTHTSSDPLWSVLIDAGQMEQVIVNLVLNARDAMHAAGTIAIDVKNVALGGREGLPSATLLPGDYILLTVADSGVGMSPDVLSHIFEPFYTTKPVGSGSGLGLSICHGVVKQAGGVITVESEVGRGSTFRVYLPRAEPASAMSGKSSDVTSSYALAQRTHAQRRQCVLLVEDEDAVRTLLTRALRNHGYDVHAARCGEDALTLHAQMEPAADLLITDIVMPGMRGTAVARAMREQVPSLRVLYITGYIEPGVLEGIESETARSESAQLLLKPFTPSQLVSRVSLLLDR